ncbi:MAG TPA: thiamine pyrophosphate-dependent dehydrogenase E1 component subunit alpha [Burkholderiales bacterium]|nr:thiamine pyrophosphate-dependent dehydrogenase E1 component subunit alpha [Burkholderiales bacterium]
MNEIPPTESVLSLYRTMCLIRAFDTHAGDARRAGKLRGSVHEYIGQEAIATGVCANLDRADYISSYHRGHGHCLAKGADPEAMMKELYGRVGGVCGGKGGSMHVADFSLGILGANGVVADGVTIAVGAAHAVKMKGEQRVVVAFFGDGAMNRGPMLEALNWASVFGLPVLFVCEDNLYSDRTRTGSVSAGPGPLARAAAFGIAGETVDGNDVIAVSEAAARHVREVREHSRPRFLHATTYRWRGHLALDKGLYRDPREVERWQAVDPIVRTASWLSSRGVERTGLSRENDAAIERVARAVAAAETAPWPDHTTLYTDVQDVGAPS